MLFHLLFRVRVLQCLSLSSKIEHEKGPVESSSEGIGGKANKNYISMVAAIGNRSWNF